MMFSPCLRRRERALSRYWNALLSDPGATAEDVEPALAALIRDLHRSDRVESIDPSVARRLEERLRFAPATPSAPAAVAGAPARLTLPFSGPYESYRHRRLPRPAFSALSALAVLALLAVALMTSMQHAGDDSSSTIPAATSGLPGGYISGPPSRQIVQASLDPSAFEPFVEKAWNQYAFHLEQLRRGGSVTPADVNPGSTEGFAAISVIEGQLDIQSDGWILPLKQRGLFKAGERIYPDSPYRLTPGQSIMIEPGSRWTLSNTGQLNAEWVSVFGYTGGEPAGDAIAFPPGYSVLKCVEESTLAGGEVIEAASPFAFTVESIELEPGSQFVIAKSQALQILLLRDGPLSLQLGAERSSAGSGKSVLIFDTLTVGDMLGDRLTFMNKQADPMTVYFIQLGSLIAPPA